MMAQPFETASIDELEQSGTRYEEIREPDSLTAEVAVELLEKTAENCRWARVNCCGTTYTICMVPGVWYCCRNGNCRTCYRI